MPCSLVLVVAQRRRSTLVQEIRYRQTAACRVFVELPPNESLSFGGSVAGG
ncbi:hypothetical protein [Salinispora arenicola]|uniref:hypothetical protein n=1 Tax=Salinispora arenicola TaxID=168697 RepID=UPI0003A03607|nr:hypothetical protein [Salinispora arenicola]